MGARLFLRALSDKAGAGAPALFFAARPIYQ